MCGNCYHEMHRSDEMDLLMRNKQSALSKLKGAQGYLDSINRAIKEIHQERRDLKAQQECGQEKIL